MEIFPDIFEVSGYRSCLSIVAPLVPQVFLVWLWKVIFSTKKRKALKPKIKYRLLLRHFPLRAVNSGGREGWVWWWLCWLFMVWTNKWMYQPKTICQPWQMCWKWMFRFIFRRFLNVYIFFVFSHGRLLGCGSLVLVIRILSCFSLCSQNVGLKSVLLW